MQPAPATALPAFDQAQLDRRFLAELDRLLQLGAFPTYTAWAARLGVRNNYVAAIASGRYHCNLALLYNTVRHFPACDFNYVVFGAAVYARPEPSELPARPRGPRPKTPRAPRLPGKPVRLDELPPAVRAAVEEGLRELDAGLGRPHEEVWPELKAEFGFE